MARIPMGDFGQRAVQTSPTPTATAEQLDGGLSDATQRLGNTLAAVGQNAIDQQVHADQVRQRAQAALSLTQTTNEMYAAHDEVAQGVASGTIDPTDARSELIARVDKIKNANLAGLTSDQRLGIDDHLVRAQGNIERSLNGVIAKRNQSDTMGTIGQFGEQAQRDAMRIGPVAAAEKYNALVDFAGGSAGMSPEAQAVAKQKFKEGVTLSYFDRAGTDALTQGSIPGVTAVLEKVRGPDGDVMDPMQRTALEHKLFGYQQNLEAKARIAANQQAELGEQQERAAKDIYGKMLDLRMNGQHMDADSIATLVNITTGTTYEKDAVALIASQKQIAGFASLSQAQRTAELNAARAAGADPAVGTNPQAAKLLADKERIDSGVASAGKENPWEAAQKYGKIKDASTFDLSTPASVLAVVNQRMSQIGDVENWLGKKITPLQPVEAEGLSRIVKALPIDQQATFLGQIGKVVGDPERIAALAQQIGDKDGHLGLAMSYANAQTTEGRAAAELLLRGSQAVRDKTVKVDGTTETGWRASVAKQIRGAFSNQDMEDKYVESAFLMTVANGGKVDNAVRLATGGIVNFNGSRVPMPYGMARDGQSAGEKSFRAAIEAITPADIAAQAADGSVVVGNTRMPVEQFVKTLPSAQLVHAGQGLYNVRAGSGLVTNAAGQRITLKVRP